jgi:DNA-binding MarR family transcriptional regulator
VDEFLTTQVVRLGHALRRTITQPYVAEAGLTQSQWRILSVLAAHPEMTLNALATEAAVDKALVSRTLRQLEELHLVRLDSVPNAPRKGLRCRLSASGARLHARTIDKARGAQAAVLLRLDPAERRAAWQILQKLSALCEQAEADR